jgi:hypothetical protein
MIGKMNLIVTILGICYGITLILAAFIRNKITEAMRIDALFMPRPTDSTRPLNLIIGILVAGYSIYSLLKG